MNKVEKQAIIFIMLAVILISFVVVTLVGALALWVLSHFIAFEFSWYLAIGIGILISLISGGYSVRSR